MAWAGGSTGDSKGKYMTLTEVRAQLAAQRLVPKKQLGQNFLIDRHQHEKIVKAAELSQEDLVVEVGPGLGNLTVHLAPAVKKMVCLEYDSDLIPLLQENMQAFSQVDIREQDVRTVDWSEIFHGRPFKVIANIPYYLTSYLLRQLSGLAQPPDLMVLLIQREVADRLRGSSPQMNLLAASAQLHFSVEKITQVPASCFWPAPKVDSAVVRLRPHHHFALSAKEEEQYFHLLHVGFGQKRKQLAPLLADYTGIKTDDIRARLGALDLPTTCRAQELSVEQWIKLTETI